MGVDEMRPGGERVLVEQIGEFDAAFGEDSHFDRGDASEAPEGIGDGLHQLALAQADGLIFVAERGEMAFVFGGVPSGEQYSAASEAGLDGVEASCGHWCGGSMIVNGIETDAGRCYGDAGCHGGGCGGRVPLVGLAGEFLLLAFEGATDGSGSHQKAPENEMARAQESNCGEPARA